MKTLFLILMVFLFCPIKAQVGINTTTPKASLEIEATNPTSPNEEDGILIPRIDEFSLTAPSSAQDGMLVFATGNGTPTKGFYYWDNTLSTWV
ncbi:MAG: hypothetical protein HKN09_04800, partial [Saprospiraceae bacterium]|nr:hypothetical protein [Saprospiraceae bacterium]